MGTFENYSRVADPLIGMIVIRSICFAAFTTAVCAVVGFPLAYGIARAPIRWRFVLLTLIMIPFWTNFLVRTYAWVLILRADGVLNTVLQYLGVQSLSGSLLFTDVAVGVGLIYGYLPFMVLPLVVAVERISPDLEAAALDLYSSVGNTFWYIVLPLSKPGFWAGGILVFIPSLGAFITPYLLGGGKTMMLGTLIQQEFLVSRDWPFGSALSFGLVGLVLMIWLVISRVTLEEPTA